MSSWSECRLTTSGLLEWDDVDLDTNFIHVSKSWNYERSASKLGHEKLSLECTSERNSLGLKIRFCF